MALNANELRQVVDELDASLAGAFVQKAYAPLPALAVLELRVPGQSVAVLLSAEPQTMRLAVIDDRPPAPPRPLSFQGALRKELIGARLTAVSSPAPFVARLDFEVRGQRRALALVLRGQEANVVLLDGEGRVLATALRTASTPRTGAPFELPRFEDPDPGPSRLDARRPEGHRFPYAAAAQVLLGGQAEGQRADVVRRRMVQPLKARLQRLARTAEKVKAEADRAKDADAHREKGELLAQNLFRVERGATSVTATRYTDQGPEEVTLPLDPRRSPKEQVEWHFHQYRRLTRGQAHAQRRLQELAEETAQVERALDELQARSDEALAADAPALVQAQATARRKGPERSRPFKVFTASTGHRILVGRGAEANDALTFHVALPHHLWLHARGVPGSHVVLERKKGEDVPPEALLDAAHLAHHHAQRKDEPRGEVAWTEARYVKKPKGSPAGAVTYTREKVLLLRLEPERLQRLLRASPI